MTANDWATVASMATAVGNLGFPLRNAGSGIAVLHGWIFHPEWHRSEEPPDVSEFRRQNRDLYVPPGDDDDGWIASSSRHWNIDRPQPR